jgi:hypothetical protein
VRSHSDFDTLIASRARCQVRGSPQRIAAPPA